MLCESSPPPPTRAATTLSFLFCKINGRECEKCPEIQTGDLMFITEELASAINFIINETTQILRLNFEDLLI